MVGLSGRSVVYGRLLVVTLLSNLITREPLQCTNRHSALIRSTWAFIWTILHWETQCTDALMLTTILHCPLPLGATAVGNKQRTWLNGTILTSADFYICLLHFIWVIEIMNIITMIIIKITTTIVIETITITNIFFLHRDEPVTLVLCWPWKKTVPGRCRKESVQLLFNENQL